MNQEKADEMTATKARQLARTYLNERRIPFTKLKARSVSFQDLARATRIFVDVHGAPASEFDAMKDYAATEGFYVKNADGMFG